MNYMDSLDLGDQGFLIKLWQLVSIDQLKKIKILKLKDVNNCSISSDGRASALWTEGREFKPRIEHFFYITKS